ncbi:MAG: peptide MFS transporter [Pseudomonadota bacterium]|nr:peptide MFS transporter [Pseudomonadota bacterium]
MTEPIAAPAPSSVSPPASASGWFGHPRALARLFTTEMWERMGYYGMRALLTLYLTKHFVLGDRASTGLFGGFSALVYLTPLIGGLIADQYLGSKRSVRFGAAMMAVGYFALAFGGSPARSIVTYDGAAHAVVSLHFHDGPTSAPDDSRQIIDHGQRLTLHGNRDGSLMLSAPSGQVVRQLAKGSYSQTSHADPVIVAILLAALATIGVGNGFFKPNISTMVGALYAQGDTRRDAGFTIFYMGVNMGSILGQFLCPLLADWLGWWAGFGIAGVGMTIAFLLISYHGGRLDAVGNTPARTGGDRAWLIYGGAVLAIPLAYLLFVNLMAAPEPAAGSGFTGYLLALPLMAKLLFGIFVLAVPAILGWSALHGTRQELQMMAAAMVLIVFNTVFWTLFEQAGSSLTLFADRNTDRSVFGWFTMSAPQTQNFNPVAIVLLAPLMSVLWGWLAKRRLEPSIPVKFGLALAGVGGGFLFLVFGARFAGPDFKVGLWWLAGLYVIQSVAELCISPVGLSMITKLSLARIVGLMMGVWFLSIAVAEYVAGLIAQLGSVATVGGEVTDPRLSLATYLHVFTTIGWVAVALGAVLLALAMPLRRLMHGVT